MCHNRGGQRLTKAQIKRINDELLNQPLSGGGSQPAQTFTRTRAEILKGSAI